MNTFVTRSSMPALIFVAVLLIDPLSFAQAAADTRAVEPKAPAAAVVATPEDLLKRYSESMRTGDFAGSAALMHPEALVQFQRVMAELASIDTSGQVSRQLFGLPEGQTIASLKPTDAFAKMLQVLTTAVPEMAEALKSSTATLLGSVKEGELVHIVYRSRMEFGGKPIDKVEVLSAKRDGGSWRALLRADMENALGGIVQRLKAAQAKP